MGLLLFTFWDLLGPKSNPGPNIQSIIAKMNPGPKKMTKNLRKLTKNRPKMFQTGPHSHQPVQAPRDQPLQVPGGAAVARRMASSIFLLYFYSFRFCGLGTGLDPLDPLPTIKTSTPRKHWCDDCINVRYTSKDNEIYTVTTSQGWLGGWG